MQSSIDVKKLLKDTDVFLGSTSDAVQTPEAKAMIQGLSLCITQHNNLYYTQQPIISDVQYDDLFQLLLQLETLYPEYIYPDSPTQKIALTLQSGFTKKEHGGHRLLSLKNSYDAVDLYDRDASLLKKYGDDTPYTFLVEPKFDGASVHLVYEYGHFIAGITRGDGYVGEDITENMKAVQNLPLYVPDMKYIPEVRLRAEVIMPSTAFEMLNIEQKDLGLPVFANERNATSGTLRQLDPHVVRRRGLIVYVLDLIDRKYDENIPTDIQRKKLLSSWGLPLFDRFAHVDSIAEVVALCENAEKKKELYDRHILFDGLVIKLNELQLRKEIGTTDHHPRWAIAFKYPAEQTITKVLDITYQIGRTGVITPVAELEPVNLSGATISRATLHNFDFIHKLDIRLGDAVWLQRSGEVIPYIIGPVIERRTGDEMSLDLPTHCPVCTTLLIRHEGEVALLCPNNIGCTAQQKEQLKHAFGKHCLNITGLGNAFIEQLVDVQLLHSRSDIYTLFEQENILTIRSLPGIAKKKIQQLKKEIEQATHVEIWRLLHACGIQFVGKKVARVLQTYLAEHVEKEVSFEQIISLLTNKEALEHIYGLGTQTIESLLDYFTNEYYMSMLQQAYDQGCTFFIPSSEPIASGGILLGETIVLTGSLPLSRDKMSDILLSYGAHVSESISGKTTLLVYGDNPGSKVDKARSKGIKTVGLDQFFKEYKIPEIADLLFAHKKGGGEHMSVGLFRS